MQYVLPYVSSFDKKAHLLLFVDFELAVLGGSTVDKLFIALCCASIAAPVPEIHTLKVRKYTRCNYEKRPVTLPLLSINMATA